MSFCSDHGQGYMMEGVVLLVLVLRFTVLMERTLWQILHGMIQVTISHSMFIEIRKLLSYNDYVYKDFF